uniref:Uncharacterized protein n=1 Tax=Rhizophora mucronata TaxID=61149 RepID=A0A2P2Q5L7_RHIMU
MIKTLISTNSAQFKIKSMFQLTKETHYQTHVGQIHALLFNILLLAKSSSNRKEELELYLQWSTYIVTP